jgi:riboflavin biosynthesis pyrimidine reductase
VAVEQHFEWARARVRRLLDDGPDERLVAVAVASADGNPVLDGRSGGLSSDADQALVYAWREAADVLLVGSRTLDVERYGSLLPEALQAARAKRGVTPIPGVATVSRDGSLNLDRILRANEPPVLTVYSDVPKPGETRVTWRRLPDLSATAVVDDLHRHGARRIVCEGGPRLYTEIFAAGLATDFSLTIAPLLVGGDERLVPGGDGPLHQPSRLVDVEAVGSHIFAHYVR